MSGTAHPGDPRDTSVARIDDNMVLGYGARANEESYTWALAHMAAFAVETFDADVASDEDRFLALQERTAGALAYDNSDVRSIQSVQAEYVSLQSSYGAAQERHTATLQIAENALADVTQVNDEEVAVKLLALQTQLQVSYEATAMISQMSLVQYL